MEKIPMVKVDDIDKMLHDIVMLNDDCEYEVVSVLAVQDFYKMEYYNIPKTIVDGSSLL